MEYSFDDTIGDPGTINPADLHNTDMFTFGDYNAYCNSADSANLNDLAQIDSAVDLTTWHPSVLKQEPVDDVSQFLDLGESAQGSSTGTATSSPQNEQIIFSNANSPGFARETSSPDDILGSRDVKRSPSEDVWSPMGSTSDAIIMPHTRDAPKVYLTQDKTKTRAETQIKMTLTLDPMEGTTEYISFPRKTLAKPKHFATAEEQKEIESKGEVTHMDALLVCATAVEKLEDLERAFRRAAGKEPVPRRPSGVAIQDLDKDDLAHPQNGGEVLICEGCKERERKRYDRKKKRAEDEKEWTEYERDRVIMINEKEYKKWKDIESGDQQFSSRAKQVDFAMRIACYCRHQEEKSPMGYRVIFTFTDARGNLLAQHASDIFQITDDHKNKETAPENLIPPLTIPQYMAPQYSHGAGVAPLYQQYPMESQYSAAMYSQPTTPAVPTFSSSMSPMEATFPQAAPSLASSQPPRQAAPTFSTTGQYPRHQHSQSYYDIPILSPTTTGLPEPNYLHRPLSLDNFNFSSEMQYPQHQSFASAPPSAGSTPINLSRPASPSWEQGPTKKKGAIRCVYFFVEE